MIINNTTAAAVEIAIGVVKLSELFLYGSNVFSNSFGVVEGDFSVKNP